MIDASSCVPPWGEQPPGEPRRRVTDPLGRTAYTTRPVRQEVAPTSLPRKRVVRSSPLRTEQTSIARDPKGGRGPAADGHRLPLPPVPGGAVSRTPHPGPSRAPEMHRGGGIP